MERLKEREGRDMPKYYFHIRKGDVFEEAVEPIEADGREAVEEEAVEAARDLLAEGDLVGLDRRLWVFEVADESGTTILSMPFSEAIEPDVPDENTAL